MRRMTSPMAMILAASAAGMFTPAGDDVEAAKRAEEQVMSVRRNEDARRAAREAEEREQRTGCYRYTSSIDAALTLVPEGYTLQVHFVPVAPHFQPSVHMYRHHDLSGKADIDAESATLPLALCIAALRARMGGS